MKRENAMYHGNDVSIRVRYLVSDLLIYPYTLFSPIG